MKTLLGISAIVFASVSISAYAVPASELRMPSNARTLAARIDKLDDQCRGGSGDVPSTQRACDQREKLLPKLTKLGWCWGHANDIDADRDWVRCAPGDH